MKKTGEQLLGWRFKFIVTCQRSYICEDPFYHSFDMPGMGDVVNKQQILREFAFLRQTRVTWTDVMHKFFFAHKPQLIDDAGRLFYVSWDKY